MGKPMIDPTPADVERCKAELPDVTVRTDSGLTFKGRVRGRKLDYAHVIYTCGCGIHTQTEVAWVTVTRAWLNNIPIGV